jgi:hypothetical protein
MRVSGVNVVNDRTFLTRPGLAFAATGCQHRRRDTNQGIG